MDDHIQIGLIGLGEMGRMYAERLHRGGWKRVNVCDRPERFDALREELKDSGLTVMRDGHQVSRQSDVIIYSVEAEFIDRVVAEFGPSTKLGAIVAGQTSVKAPERAAFEAHLPADVSIVSVHSLHGPTVNPEGQALVIIRHRASDEDVQLVERILAPLRSRHVYLSYEEHDEVTANTQAVTHAAFLSMGTAWRNMGSFPWETGRYIRGVETAKTNICLRIYSQKWHVYAGLAILNPAARKQIDQYARSTSELFALMIGGREAELRKRVMAARAFVFGGGSGSRPPLFVSDRVLDKFAIVPRDAEAGPEPRNSQLSLLAMVDSWAQLRIRPFVHLDLAATPVFRLWFGVVQHLFDDEAALEDAISAAVSETSHRQDDLEFTIAARGWSECISFGSFPWYKDRFDKTAEFFQPRFEQSKTQAAAMIKEILAESRAPTSGKA